MEATPLMREGRVTCIEHPEFLEYVATNLAEPDDYMAATRDMIAKRGTGCVRIWCLPPDLPLTGAELAAIADHSVGSGLAGRVALVAPSDLSYGLARLHVAYRADSETFGLFRDRDAAVDWITNGPAPGADA